MQSPVTPLIQSPRPPHTSICGPGNGTFLLEGQMWFQYWGMLTSAFHHDILRPSMGHMAYSVQLMVVSPPLFHLHISHQAQSIVHSQTDISVKHPSDTAPQNNAVNPRDTHVTHWKCTNTLSNAETLFYSQACSLLQTHGHIITHLMWHTLQHTCATAR